MVHSVEGEQKSQAFLATAATPSSKQERRSAAPSLSLVPLTDDDDFASCSISAPKFSLQIVDATPDCRTGKKRGRRECSKSPSVQELPPDVADGRHDDCGLLADPIEEQHMASQRTVETEVPSRSFRPGATRIATLDELLNTADQAVAELALYSNLMQQKKAEIPSQSCEDNHCLSLIDQALGDLSIIDPDIYGPSSTKVNGTSSIRNLHLPVLGFETDSDRDLGSFTIQNSHFEESAVRPPRKRPRVSCSPFHQEAGE